MPSIRSIHIAPVKSLALSEVDNVHVGGRGIENDRRFLVLDSDGRVVSQRQIGKLTQVRSEYSVGSDELTLTFPDGSLATGRPSPIREAATVLWGRVVTGSVIDGDWSDALSSFCVADLTLMKTRDVGACFDEYPVSVLSQASIDYLTGLSGGTQSFHVDRFRPTFLIDGCGPHEEDSWLGRGLRIGEQLQVRLVSPDPRCAITTLDPKTGERDFDTLRLILSYRPSPRAAYFGTYGIVEAPGTVRAGDAVVVGR